MDYDGSNESLDFVIVCYDIASDEEGRKRQGTVRGYLQETWGAKREVESTYTFKLFHDSEARWDDLIDRLNRYVNKKEDSLTIWFHEMNKDKTISFKKLEIAKGSH